MQPLLAYTPFLQPLNLHESWWFTLIPVAWFLAMAYKGVRLRELSSRVYWRAVAVMSAQIVVGLVGLAAGLYAFIEWIVPRFQG